MSKHRNLETMNKSFTIRQAERRDVPLLLEFIRGIAKYEKLEDQVVATEALLREWIFWKKEGGIADHDLHSPNSQFSFCGPS